MSRTLFIEGVFDVVVNAAQAMEPMLNNRAFFDTLWPESKELDNHFEEKYNTALHAFWLDKVLPDIVCFAYSMDPFNRSILLDEIEKIHGIEKKKLILVFDCLFKLHINVGEHAFVDAYGSNDGKLKFDHYQKQYNRKFQLYWQCLTNEEKMYWLSFSLGENPKSIFSS